MGKKQKRRELARLKKLKKQGMTPSDEAGHEPKPHAPVHHTHHTPKTHHEKPKGFLKNVKHHYEHNYKKLLWIPFIILLLALAQIGFQAATTGDFMNKGVSLKGGVTVTIPDVQADILALEETLVAKFPGYDINIRSLSAAGKATGLVIDADMLDQDKVTLFTDTLAQELNVLKDNFGIETVGSSLGESFFKETIIALLLAFVFMALVVFAYFRIPAPSAAVVLAAVSDIIVTLAITNMLNIKISTAGIAAFLMLVGYSVDTDILLSTRVLKRKEGTVMDGVYRAMKTGLTMTITTIVAVTVGLIVSQSEVLIQIMTIVLIGLLVDLINTWIQNVGLLRWYLEYAETKKARKAQHEHGEA